MDLQEALNLAADREYEIRILPKVPPARSRVLVYDHHGHVLIGVITPDPIGRIPQAVQKAADKEDGK